MTGVTTDISAIWKGSWRVTAELNKMVQYYLNDDACK